MIDTIYIEQAVLEHPRVQQLLTRFSSAHHLVIERYAEVFNSHAQNFRLQKSNPAMILAQKPNRKVLPTPQQYETGGGATYYFSHMLNCLYDCRYCFLQGMYRSANYLLFVNYEEFVDEIRQTAAQHTEDSKAPWFYSGYDCDSLALEPVTGFAGHFLDAFAQLPKAVLELRTKSTQVRSLLERKALPNVVVAFSLNPDQVARAVEEGAPSLAKRISAMRKLQDAGWRVGVRIDPVIWHAEATQNYALLVEQVFTQLDAEKVDSVTIGGFRLPKGYFKTMRKLYPKHWLFSAGLEEHEGMICYAENLEAELFGAVQSQVAQFFDPQRTYVYRSRDNQEALS